MHASKVVCVNGLKEMKGVFDTVGRSSQQEEVMRKMEVCIDGGKS